MWFLLIANNQFTAARNCQFGDYGLASKLSNQAQGREGQNFLYFTVCFGTHPVMSKLSGMLPFLAN
jgi:hypothetical protein